MNITPRAGQHKPIIMSLGHDTYPFDFNPDESGEYSFYSHDARFDDCSPSAKFVDNFNAILQNTRQKHLTEAISALIESLLQSASALQVQSAGEDEAKMSFVGCSIDKLHSLSEMYDEFTGSHAEYLESLVKQGLCLQEICENGEIFLSTVRESSSPEAQTKQWRAALKRLEANLAEFKCS
ncbi:hypothetical protein NliqN6_3403 [Naganishia liquefaciens]|uniref:Uncharacterized protein n=1 Tax=Naganishia liquefaciens TaxID=104408 RepID=A0A8H3TT42_9TREE|nr:hypothetical protein NliqN6_3403 [Naganishia liquefaciens]